ncbi:hypothetical protein [Streptomyces sp. NPDC059909]|uniref:hypothetical protein n=1 Tax=Streptomyces sp. NPDC059909 TaxID=3346998 RepID=UPI0036526288
MDDTATGSRLLTGQIPAQAHTVGPGWDTLLDRLHRDLVALAPDYQIESFGTKFGGLRIAVADRFDDQGEFDGEFTDAATALIDTAELASEQMCETCGHPGRPRFRGDQYRTWIQTSCDNRHSAPQAGATSSGQATP